MDPQLGRKMSASASVIIKPTFTLTDRIKIQQERIRNREYKAIGKLTCVVWEGQRSSYGLSQDRGLGLDSFGKWKRKAWSSITLDWLNHTNAPILAVSSDRNDLLLPFKLTPLPKIPDPRWMGHNVEEVPGADCTDPKVPRIPQPFAGCPVVGDRACGQITDRVSGKTFLIFQPLTELQILCGKGKESGFGRISFRTDPVERTHAALLVNAEPDNEGMSEAYFVGGTFHAG
jgi:hypothetical protein